MLYFDDLDQKITQNKHENGTINWGNVVYLMGRDHPKEHNTKERWRTMWRRKNNTRFAVANKQATTRRDDKRMNRYTIRERLLPMLKVRRGLKYLVERLGETESAIKSTIMDLQYDGYNIKMWKEDTGNGEQTMFHLEPMIENLNKQYTNYPEGFIEELTGGQEFKIAIVSDTHMGSTCEALDELNEFYDYAIASGVKDFYHVGDITDGYYMQRTTSIYEQHKIGFQQQIDWVIDQYPQRDGVTTSFITGNHDVTHLKNGGADIGKMIEKDKRRYDMIYLGHNFADVCLANNVNMFLVHPTDGGAYSVSHKMQKYIDGIAGERPSIVAMGHYHKMNWIYWKGVHGFTMPSFQFQTQFMKDNSLLSYVGGYILTIKVDSKGRLLSVVPEFVELG